MPSVASLIVVILFAALRVNAYEYDIIEGDIQVPKRGVTSQEHSFKQLGEWVKLVKLVKLVGLGPQ